MSDGTIRNRFKILLAEKEANEGRRISYRDIQEATGIAQSNLSAYANHRVVQYHASTLARLCKFFNCTIGDLLEYIPPKK